MPVILVYVKIKKNRILPNDLFLKTKFNLSQFKRYRMLIVKMFITNCVTNEYALSADIY